MGQKCPLTGALRFLLEVVVVAAIASYGLKRYRRRLWRFVAAVPLPLAAVVVWRVFAVPSGPSRAGAAPVPVAGWIRLVLELSIFGLATSLRLIIRPNHMVAGPEVTCRIRRGGIE